MLIELIPNDNITLDYKQGIVNLNKSESYIIQHSWAIDLAGKKKQISINPYTINIDSNNQNILIIRSLGMGDMLFLSAVTNIIKLKYPNCKIGYAAVKSQHELLKLIPTIDDVIEYPIKKSEFDKYKYHITIDGLIEGNKENKERNIYEVLLNHIGVYDYIDNKYCNPQLGDSFKLGNLKTTKLIGIHPFAADPIRQLNLYIVSLLCNKLIDIGYSVIIFSNQLEKDKYQSLFKKNINWSIDNGKSIENTIEVLKTCETVISTDSVITHLCQVTDTNCICIFGPFSSTSRVEYYKNITIIDNNPNCRCYSHGIGSCPKGYAISPCLTFDTDNIIDLLHKKSVEFGTDVALPIIQKYNW